MKHYTDENWLDFARGLLSAEKQQRMQAHLDAGCEQCGQLAALWAQANRTTMQWSLEAPPESAVRLVKATFSQLQQPKPPSLLTRVAQLLFDSFVAAPAAGVRSISSTARHLLYQFDSWTIDLRLDNDGGKGVTISGQVLESAAESSQVAADVTLLRGDVELATVSTNEFGEFQLVADSADDLSIRLTLAQQTPVLIKFPQ